MLSSPNDESPANIEAAVSFHSLNSEVRSPYTHNLSPRNRKNGGNNQINSKSVFNELSGAVKKIFNC